MQGNEGDRTGGNSIELASYRLSRNSNAMIHSDIRALYTYWDRLRAGRPCPYQAEVTGSNSVHRAISPRNTKQI